LKRFCSGEIKLLADRISRQQQCLLLAHWRHLGGLIGYPLPTLCGSSAQADLNKLLPSADEKFPTGAMASFRFDGAWKAPCGSNELWSPHL
jgi:hypothetical protein